MKSYDSARHKSIRHKTALREKFKSRSISLFIKEIKSHNISKSCAICGEIFDPVMMQFDHVDRSTKSCSISNIHSKRSFSAVISEIKKCQLICIYCHRKKTRLESIADSVTMLINDKTPYFGPKSIICKRCRVQQDEKCFITCKNKKIMVCRQCERNRTREKRKSAFEFVNSIKASTPCVDCGKFYDAVCMDFDHLPCFKKNAGINIMASQGYSSGKIKIEMEKCEIVCAGCHLVRTKNRLSILFHPLQLTSEYSG